MILEYVADWTARGVAGDARGYGGQGRLILDAAFSMARSARAQIPPNLQKKIRSFYEYLWDSGQDSYSMALFEEMPEKLKLQLNVALKRRLIEKVDYDVGPLAIPSSSI